MAGQIAAKRWRIDLNAAQQAVLMLSAVNLPGGVQVIPCRLQPTPCCCLLSGACTQPGLQRRRTAEDELTMRFVYDRGDLIAAEVQQLHADGSIVLHTRSYKYGKACARQLMLAQPSVQLLTTSLPLQLEGGQLVMVPANLIKRQKQHFHTYEDLGGRPYCMLLHSRIGRLSPAGCRGTYHRGLQWLSLGLLCTAAGHRGGPDGAQAKQAAARGYCACGQQPARACCAPLCGVPRQHQGDLSGAPVRAWPTHRLACSRCLHLRRHTEPPADGSGCCLQLSLDMRLTVAQMLRSSFQEAVVRQESERRLAL